MSPNAPGRGVRVLGVEQVLGAAVVVDDLELVLEPLDARCLEVQDPFAVVAGELARREIAAQTHGGVALVGIGEADEHPLMMTLSLRPARNTAQLRPLVAAEDLRDRVQRVELV